MVIIYFVFVCMMATAEALIELLYIQLKARPCSFLNQFVLILLRKITFIHQNCKTSRLLLMKCSTFVSDKSCVRFITFLECYFIILQCWEEDKSACKFKSVVGFSLT